MPLYHISKTRNLKVLQPSVSTHGKAWVYAIKDLTTGLYFGAEKDDFDLMLYQNKEKNIPEVWECYVGAFDMAFNGKSCSIYELEDSGFESGRTSWSPELVSENSTKVLKETNVKNLKVKLLEECKKGKIIINYYEDTPKYKAWVSAHIVDRLVRFNYISKNNADIRSSILKHYSSILNRLRDLTSGEYL